MKTQNDMVRFYQIAELRLSELGPRDKNINIKVARNTAQMMVNEEKRLMKAAPELLEAAKAAIAEIDRLIREKNPLSGERLTNPASVALTLAIAKAEGRV